MKRNKNLVDFAKEFIANKDYRFRYLAYKGLFHNMSDEKYLRKLYKASIGKDLNLTQPNTFNEKLQWLKLNDRRIEYTKMVDKYLVRQYIAETIGEQYLIPLIGVWNSPEEIDFDSLPNQFVLKCNHNSGLGMCICKDKSKLNIGKVQAALKKGFNEDYYYLGREWPYKNVKRKIICEKYMTDGNDQLADYKIHNFNGIPRVILVCRDRFKESGLTEDFFSDKWEHLNIQRPGHPNSQQVIPKPSELNEMLLLSRQLSKDIPFVRTDFYTIQGKVYFGEITFYPASGMDRFEPDTIDQQFGEWLNLPIVNK